MRASVPLVLFSSLVVLVPMWAFAAEPSAPAISLQGICSNGSATMMLNHPPKVPVVEDRSPKKELAYWNQIKDSNDASLFLVYISNFQNGMFMEAAVEKYKRNCGDLTALPVGVLSCQPDVAPPAKPPLKKVAFIPPPPKKPIIKIHIPIVKLHPHIKIRPHHIIKKVLVIYPDPFTNNSPSRDSNPVSSQPNTVGSQGNTFGNQGNTGGTLGKP